MKTENTNTSLLEEQQETEAYIRLKALTRMGLHENVLREWCENQTVYYSERQRIFGSTVGVLYWLSNEDELTSAVRDFEQKHNALVYYCTLDYTEFGRLLNMFYVSEYVDEWNRDIKELKEKNPVVYVKNLDDDMCSEFGGIAFDVAAGGLVRAA